MRTFYAFNDCEFITGREKFYSPIPELNEEQIQGFKDLVVAFNDSIEGMLDGIGNVSRYNRLGHELDYFAMMYPTFDYEKYIDEKYFPIVSTLFTSYKEENGRLKSRQKY